MHVSASHLPPESSHCVAFISGLTSSGSGCVCSGFDVFCVSVLVLASDDVDSEPVEAGLLSAGVVAPVLLPPPFSAVFTHLPSLNVVPFLHSSHFPSLPKI